MPRNGQLSAIIAVRGQQNLLVIVGTPKTVIPKIKTILSVLRTGIFIILSIQGPVGNDDQDGGARWIRILG